MPRPIPVSIRITDVQTMMNCKKALDSVVDALASTNWQGAKPTIATLAIVDQFICDLYNRSEKYWLAYLNRGGPTRSRPSGTRRLQLRRLEAPRPVQIHQGRVERWMMLRRFRVCFACRRTSGAR